ncbi:MAG: hypothetical protein ACQES9_11640 [Myxococcota bacterium]
MICPFCGDAVDDRSELCPTCGAQLNDITYDEDASFDEDVPNNKTAIVSLDPEFEKGTKIFTAPTLDGSSKKKRTRRKKLNVEEEDERDEFTKMWDNLKIGFKRMNFLEKIALVILLLAAIFSFAPWLKNPISDTWVSGFELEGIYVAISVVGSIIILILKMNLRLGLGFSVLHLVLAFLGALIPVYLFIRGTGTQQPYLLSYYIVLITACLGFLFAFLGALKRFFR